MPDPAADLQRLIALADAVWQASHTRAGSVTQAMAAHATHYDAVLKLVRDDAGYRDGYHEAMAKLLPHYRPSKLES